MVNKPAVRLPLSVVTGALGSGKTTLIAGLLRRPEFAGTGVLVNEFASLGLDDMVLQADRQDGGDVVLLRNGCVCCGPADDLTLSVLRLHARVASGRNPAARLLVETSGLADPVALLHRLTADLRLRSHIRLAGVVTVVDALHLQAELARSFAARHQVAMADVHVITKDDLTTRQQLCAVSDRLRTINPGAAVVVGQQAAQTEPDLLSASLYSDRTGQLDAGRWLNRSAYAGVGQGHDEEIRSWLVESRGAICWEQFATRARPLVEQGRDHVLRVKGLLDIGEKEGPLAIHGVRDVFHRPVRLSSWPDRERRSSIVLIGQQEAGALIAEWQCALDESSSPPTRSSPSSSLSGDPSTAHRRYRPVL